MAKFAYNNTKNASIAHTSLELNCRYHSHMLFEEDIDLWFRLMLAGELLSKLYKLMIFCCKNLFCTQEFQNQAHNKTIQPQSYALNNKVLLNNKYIKTR